MIVQIIAAVLVIALIGLGIVTLKIRQAYLLEKAAYKYVSDQYASLDRRYAKALNDLHDAKAALRLLDEKDPVERADFQTPDGFEI